MFSNYFMGFGLSFRPFSATNSRLDDRLGFDGMAGLYFEASA